MTMLKYGQVGAFKQMKVQISSSSALRKAKTPKVEPDQKLYALYTKTLGMLGKFLTEEGEKHLKERYDEDVVIEFLRQQK